MGYRLVASDLSLLIFKNVPVCISQCLFSSAFIEFMTAEDRNIVGIVGPGCTSCASSLAGVTKWFDYSFISYAAEGTGIVGTQYGDHRDTVRAL